MHRTLILAVVGLAGLLSVGFTPSAAQPPAVEASGTEDSRNAAPAGSTIPPPAEDGTRPPGPALDPTIPSAQMKAILGQQLALQAPSAQVKLPALRIKGRVVSSDGGVSVLLQVGQQLERVSAAAEWTTEDGLTIRVLSVSPTELRLQIEPHNRTVTVR